MEEYGWRINKFLHVQIVKGSPFDFLTDVKYNVPEPKYIYQLGSNKNLWVQRAPLWPFSLKLTSIFPCIILIAPSIQGSPFSHHSGTGRIASPNNSLRSASSLTVRMICLTTELESFSWFVTTRRNRPHETTPADMKATISGQCFCELVFGVR